MLEYRACNLPTFQNHHRYKKTFSSNSLSKHQYLAKPRLCANFQWLLVAQEAEKQALQAALEDWRKDWVSQDTDAYLSQYSQKFFYSDGGLQKWADYKRGIQASKPKVSIQIEDVSMFTYPATKQPVIVVNFEQNFKSLSLQNKMRKRQYWMLDNNQWKIIYEGAA